MKYLLLLSLAVICCKAYPQGYANTWVFGDSVGLKFIDGGIEIFNSGMVSFEASASISDSLGNLLFYTNGERVWNKNHEVMPNGDSLEIGTVIPDFGGSSVTQGVIIVPIPGSNKNFYIFQLQSPFPENYGIKYSIIQMDLNDGLGDVLEKNIHLLNEYVLEKMQAVKHANGRDWWLLVGQVPFDEYGIEEYAFLQYLITPSGIEGPFYKIQENIGGLGEMVFSEQGDVLVTTSYDRLEIYSFDRCSGEIIKTAEITNFEGDIVYGCSLSQDASKLYVSEINLAKKLYQYCLNCSVTIDSTKVLIYESPSIGSVFGQHQIGPDGRIYLAMTNQSSSGFTPKNKYLCVINTPNELGLACDFDTNTVALGLRVLNPGLPNMPNYNLGALRLSPCDTLNVALTNFPNQGAFTIYPNPASTIVTVKGNITMQDVVTIQSLDGQLVHTYTNSAATKQIPVTALANGVYVLQIVRNNEAYFSEKLVIMR